MKRKDDLKIECLKFFKCEEDIRRFIYEVQ